MGGTLQWLREESRKVLGIAIFFAVAFCLIVLANKLMVEGSNIKVTSFARAIIGGLIVAKVLLIADLLPFINAFPDKPLIYNIVWKSLIYIAASLVFHYVEPVIVSFVTMAMLVAAMTVGLAYSRTKGIYGGVALEGMVIGPQPKMNKAYYDQEVSPLDILVQHEVRNEGAEKLVDTVSKVAK